MSQHNVAPRIAAIIPALDEEGAIGKVVRGIAPHASLVIVANNGSRDATATRARDAGATVVSVPQAGYGRACMAGVAAAKAAGADIFLFLDGDAADDPNDAEAVLAPILAGQAQLVIGSRARGEVEAGALTLPQRFGNQLACALMRLVWGSRFTDLGPFRAITSAAYDRLGMAAPTYGWTVEMQARALRHNIPHAEVPVSSLRRIGTSKISGTVRGVVLAGAMILGTIGREAVADQAARRGGLRGAHQALGRKARVFGGFRA